MAPGVRGHYRKGGATLAVRTGTHAIPVAYNAGDFWPRRSTLKYPGVIRIAIGPPIDTAGRNATEVNRQAEEWIEATMERIGSVAPMHNPAAHESPDPPPLR